MESWKVHYLHDRIIWGTRILDVGFDISVAELDRPRAYLRWATMWFLCFNWICLREVCLVLGHALSVSCCVECLEILLQRVISSRQL